MSKNKMRFMFSIASLLLIVVVMSFTAVMNIESFKQNYTESLISGYRVVADQAVRKIEYAIRYGKSLDNFYGIENLLMQVKQTAEGIDDVKIILPDGTISASTLKDLEDSKIDKSVYSKMDEDVFLKENTYTVLQSGTYHVFIPVYDDQRVWIGTLDMTFQKQIVDKNTAIYLNQMLMYLLIISVIAAGVLILVFMTMPIVDEHQKLRNKFILTIVITVLGISEITLGISGFFIFRSAYMDVAKEHTTFVADIIAKDISQVISKGIVYSELHDLDQWMAEVSQKMSMIDNISLIDSDDSILYTVRQDAAQAQIGSKNEEIKAVLPVDREGNSGKIHISISPQYISDRMKEILLEVGTTLVTSIFFMVEIVLFFMIFIEHRVTKSVKENQGESNKDRSMIRTLAFIFFFGYFLSISFIPTYMNQIYKPLFGLPKGLILALPISMEVLCTGISNVLGGMIIEKKGWKPVLFMGVIIFAVASLLSGIAQSPILFIVARGMAGISYGFCYMSMIGYVNTTDDQEVKNKSLSAFYAGLYAAVNCAAVIGAMIGEKTGFSSVFFIMSVNAFLTVFFIILFMNKSSNGIVERKQGAESPLRQVFSFLRNKNVATFFLFILIPSGICVMFLDYYFPVFAEGAGATSASVGRAFLLNGLSIVYLGPILTSFFTKHFKVKTIIGIAVMIVIASLFQFALLPGMLTAFIAVFLLGIADSFGMVAQNKYILDMEVSKQIGENAAMGYFGIVQKFGQMLGPMVFAAVTVFGQYGIAFVGGGFFILLILFVLRGFAVDKPKQLAQ